MAGAVVGYFVSSFVAEAVAAEVVIAGLAVDSAFLITGASMIGSGVGLVAGALTSGLVNGALVGSGGNISSPQPSSVSAARSQGLLINAASNIEPVSVLYGSRRMGGAFVLEEVSGDSNEFFHLVVSLCEGEIDGFDQVYLDDVPITDARFVGLYTLETYVGTDAQAASAALIAALPGVWSATDTGSGTAYVYVRLTYSQDVFNGRPVISADVRGKKLYDPRSGLTVWSNNPALAIRDYLTNTRYGRGLAASAIDDAAIIVAANHCDEMVAIPGGTQKRYTIDGVVDINTTLLDNIKTLLSTCRGMLVLTDGVYRLVIDKLYAPAPIDAMSPTDHGTAAVVTGNVVTTVNTTSWANDGARATTGWSSGVHSWSVTIGGPTGLSHCVAVGIGNASALVAGGNTFPGADINGWGLICLYTGGTGGQIYHNNLSMGAQICSNPAAGDVIGFLLDMTAGTLTLSKNGVSLGVALTGLTGTIYPMAAAYSVGDSATFDFSVVPFAFTEDNITGAWTISQPGRRDKFNRVTASFFNGAAQWQPDFAPWDSPAYRTQDNSLLLEDKISLPYTADMYRAMQLAGLYGKQSRFGLAARFSALQEGLRCEVGDVVTITHSTPGWSAKPFRVMQIDIKSDDEVDVVVREYDASVYALDTLTAITGGPATNLPDPFTVATPASLTLTSGTAELLSQSDGTLVSRIRAVWPAPADAFIIGAEIQLKRSADSVWQTVARPGKGDVSAWISPVVDGTSYDVALRFVNAMGVNSPWTIVTGHTVVGETQVPSTVATVATTQEMCFFSKVADLDVPGYQIRALPGTGAYWALGVPLHDGLVTDSPYAYKQRLTGIQTIMVAAVDRGERVGLPASATLDFGVIDPYNIAQAYDYKAAGFPGTITNASISGGNLVADADPAVDFWALGGEDFWLRDNAADFWSGSAYLAMQYAATFAPAYAGDIIIDTTLLGSRCDIEWRADGATIGDFWAPGGSDFWAGTDYYGAMPNWHPYIGVIASTANQGIQLRVSIDSGPIQGQITAESVRLQMPDKQQVFTGISINSGGTRLAPASGTPPVQWIRVEEANFTIYADGSGTTSGRVVDFDPTLGPLVQTLNASGSAVSSTGQSVRVSGY